MKESKLIEMQRQVETLGGALSKVVQELTALRTLFMGVHETQKLMPGFDEAIEKLKERASDGKEQENTK